MARISIAKSKSKKGGWVVKVNGRSIKRYSTKAIAMKRAISLKKRMEKRSKRK